MMIKRAFSRIYSAKPLIDNRASSLSSAKFRSFATEASSTEPRKSNQFAQQNDSFIDPEDELTQLLTERAEERRKNREAKKGLSAELSDTAFDDVVEEFNIEKSQERVARIKQRGMQVADVSDHDTLGDPVEQHNIEKSEARVEKLKKEGFTVADVSDHDTLGDPVEQHNIEKAEARAEKLKKDGFTVADVSDHDTMDDPVEQHNIEKAGKPVK